jgi:hypothetical protein
MGRGGTLHAHLAHNKTSTPSDRHKALGIGLLQGPEGEQFLMREAPLYRVRDRRPPPPVYRGVSSKPVGA